MKHAAEAVFVLMIVVTWIAGIVLAVGWWKLAAAAMPPYAWYLLIERLMQLAGLVGGA